ncbi:caspase family protein [Chlorobium sp.]|uniref:caspase family protein n=1 Tax=Chlorobium sp. TaxID=1095 RepID=UPI003C55C170
MKRRALLIEASQVFGLLDLPGARKDVDDWVSYLRSPLGGAWENEEISVLHTPPKSALEISLLSASVCEYVFIAFSGHGYHVKGKGVDETRIFLSDKQEISVNKLNCGAPKTTIVIDACREVEYLKEELSAVFSMDELSLRMKYADRLAHRKLFDDAIIKSPKGAEYLYSCDLDETAGESIRGGYFSQALMRCGEKFNNKTNIYTVCDAFGCAKVIVTNKMPQQNPVCECGRRLTHYPFAVSV